MAEIFQRGALYLCPTPIGNLEDITYRTVRCLKEADLIAAEDTRHTGRLLAAYAIDTPLFSYHEHNKAEKGRILIERLAQGQIIALVSDAGMTGICDPGSDLVREALSANIPVISLPGANAGLTGLVASGMDTGLFTFIGFLPKTKKHRIPVLEKIKSYKGTLIFYEAPHRLLAVLLEMESVLGNRSVVLCRELTKKHEEYIRGTLSSVREKLARSGVRGEFVILAAGFMEEETAPCGETDYAALVSRLVAAGTDKKEAVRAVAKQCGVSKREVYQATLEV